MNVLQVIKTKINKTRTRRKQDERYFDLLGPMLLDLDGWPEDDEGEPLDLENFNINSVSDDKIVISSGGEWQTPKEMEVVLSETDDLQINVIGKSDKWEEVTPDDFEKLMHELEL